MNPLPELKARLGAYRYNPDYPEEAGALHCCRLAMTALEQGCYGAGAILISAEGQILMQDANRVFSDGYQPHRHAEMNLLDRFDAQFQTFTDRSSLTLMVSLEPCPMCLCRLLDSGIGRVRYLVADPDKGMVQRLDQLPPAWHQLAQLQHHGQARISPSLHQLASDLAAANQEALRLRARSYLRPRALSGQGVA